MPAKLIRYVDGVYTVMVEGRAWAAQLRGTRVRLAPIKYASLRYRWLGSGKAEADLPERTLLRVVSGRETEHYLLNRGAMTKLRTLRAKIPRMNAWGIHLINTEDNTVVGTLLWIGDAYIVMIG